MGGLEVYSSPEVVPNMGVKSTMRGRREASRTTGFLQGIFVIVAGLFLISLASCGESSARLIRFDQWMGLYEFTHDGKKLIIVGNDYVSGQNGAVVWELVVTVFETGTWKKVAELKGPYGYVGTCGDSDKFFVSTDDPIGGVPII